MNTIELITLLLLAFAIALQILVFLRSRGDNKPMLQLHEDMKQHHRDTSERLERELRNQVQNTAQSTR